MTKEYAEQNRTTPGLLFYKILLAVCIHLSSIQIFLADRIY